MHYIHVYMHEDACLSAVWLRGGQGERERRGGLFEVVIGGVVAGRAGGDGAARRFV
jgi:hypothetical protein